MPAVDLAARIIPARIKSDLSASPRVTQCAPTFPFFPFLLYRFLFPTNTYTFAERVYAISLEYTTRFLMSVPYE